MRLAYIANVRMPTEKAHGLQIMKTCEALASRGFDIDIIAPRRKNYLKADPFDFYKVKKNFKITKLWCLDFLNARFFKQFFFWLENITFTLKAAAYAVFNKYDIYYTRDFLAALLFPSVFYEIHTLPKRGLFLYKIAWKKSKGLVVISEGIKKDLLSYGVSENKIIIARDAVDMEKFDVGASKEECRKKLDLPLNIPLRSLGASAGQAKIVLYVGHLYKWKGADLLAQAAKDLENNAEVYLVGGTPEDMESFRKKYVFSNLHIIGWQDPGLVPLWLKAADLLILPTSGKEAIGSLYTSPMKLFEYMASGTPTISADLPSLKEVLTENEAVFFKADDAGSLVKKITESLDQLQELSGKACVAVEKVKEYTWDKRSETIEKFFSRKKVVFLTTELSHRGGWARYSMDLLKELKNGNFEIEVFTAKNAQNEGVEGMKVYPILPDSSGAGAVIWSLIKSFWRARKICRGADFFHVFVEPYAIWAWALSGGWPYYITAHGTYAIWALTNKYFGWLNRKIFSGAKNIFCVSEFTKGAMLRVAQLKNLAVINNGIDFLKFENCASRPSEQKIILGVGGIKFRKGYHVILEALPEIKKVFPNVKYFIAGSESGQRYLASLYEIIKKNNLEANVEILNNISDAEMMDLYARCSIFSMTPVNAEGQFEGFGLVYLEAGACGKPVVGTKENGAEDAIENGVTGLLVDQNDISGTAVAILKILQDGDLAHQMGQAGRAHAKKQDWKNVAEEYKIFYEYH